MNMHICKLLRMLHPSKHIPQLSYSQQSVSRTPEAWRIHWQQQNQPWRTEPEIPLDRQQELARRRIVVPNIEKGLYPFKGMLLDRADVEWLLATHENGLGPVDWSNEKQREREGLNLCGADLSGLDLSNLPLAHMQGGLSAGEWMADGWSDSDAEQCGSPVIHLEGASLAGAHLEGSYLGLAHLEGAYLIGAHLEGAHLAEAHLEGADLRGTHSQKAIFFGAHLEGADFSEAHLQQAYLSKAHLEGATLVKAHLEGADLFQAHLEGKVMSTDDAKHIRKWKQSSMQFFISFDDEEEVFSEKLFPADLRGVYFDSATDLAGIVLGDKRHNAVSRGDVHWNGADLTMVDWGQAKTLGDERIALQQRIEDGRKKKRTESLWEYQLAVRANRQLAVALESQGLNEDAARFAYRAQVLQRKVLWKQRNFWKWLGSMMLALLAGYGYRMGRILVAYLLIVMICAGAYFVLGMFYEPHLSFLDAILTSITAFHGRVFSEPFLHPGEPQLWVTAFEAVAGLIVEGVFIAMLTQRFFGK